MLDNGDDKLLEICDCVTLAGGNEDDDADEAPPNRLTRKLAPGKTP